VAWSGAASHLPATDTLSSPVLHRALRNEKAVFHARFVGGQIQPVNMSNSPIWGRRPLSGTVIVTEIVVTGVCHHCAPSARQASRRSRTADVDFGRSLGLPR
jgi:hypothetical protein